MKRSVLAVAAMLLLGWAAQARSQPAQAGPEQKKMHVWVGDWTFDQEIRDNASEAWYKAPATCQDRMILGGFVLEVRCKATVKGKGVEVLEIGSFDPVKKTHVSSFFDSDGTSGYVTSAAYSGNKMEVQYTSMAADGGAFEARCVWTFGADSMSVSGSCERLTDGKWVPFRKLTGTKAKAPVR